MDPPPGGLGHDLDPQGRQADVPADVDVDHVELDRVEHRPVVVEDLLHAPQLADGLPRDRIGIHRGHRLDADGAVGRHHAAVHDAARADEPDADVAGDVVLQRRRDEVQREDLVEAAGIGHDQRASNGDRNRPASRTPSV